MNAIFSNYFFHISPLSPETSLSGYWITLTFHTLFLSESRRSHRLSKTSSPTHGERKNNTNTTSTTNPRNVPCLPHNISISEYGSRFVGEYGSRSPHCALACEARLSLAGCDGPRFGSGSVDEPPMAWPRFPFRGAPPGNLGKAFKTQTILSSSPHLRIIPNSW